IWVGYFSFFRPHPKTGWEKEKYRSIVKELIYRTISFLLITVNISSSFIRQLSKVQTACQIRRIDTKGFI
ncbi:MAG: hypothetical protein ACYTFX_11635, partial [Planctomycetota bacterium]